MASTKADNNRVAWEYQDKKAVSYAISAKAVYVLADGGSALFGGAAADNTMRRIPKDLKVRKVKCTSPGLPAKYVTCYATNATLLTTPGTVVTLDCNGVDAVYTSTDIVREEKWRDTTRDTV